MKIPWERKFGQGSAPTSDSVELVLYFDPGNQSEDVRYCWPLVAYDPDGDILGLSLQGPKTPDYYNDLRLLALQDAGWAESVDRKAPVPLSELLSEILQRNPWTERYLTAIGRAVFDSQPRADSFISAMSRFGVIGLMERNTDLADGYVRLSQGLSGGLRGRALHTWLAEHGYEPDVLIARLKDFEARSGVRLLLTAGPDGDLACSF